MTNEKIPGAQVWQAWSGSSFCHETKAPEGSSRTTQDASPGFKIQIAGSPEGRRREVRSQPRMNARHKHLFNTGTNCFAPSGLPLLLCLFPGLAPWVFLSRALGASFAPETRINEERRLPMERLMMIIVAARLALVARASAADLEACCKMRIYFCA